MGFQERYVIGLELHELIFYHSGHHLHTSPAVCAPIAFLYPAGYRTL
jgi:hypothetical protein